jgi:hypothetical protein
MVQRLDIDRLKGATDTAELVVLQNYAMKYYDEIVELLAIVPSDLLLLFKTNDCLRHLDKILHTPVNSTAGWIALVALLLLLSVYLWFSFLFVVVVVVVLLHG